MSGQKPGFPGTPYSIPSGGSFESGAPVRLLRRKNSSLSAQIQLFGRSASPVGGSCPNVFRVGYRFLGHMVLQQTVRSYLDMKLTTPLNGKSLEPVEFGGHNTVFEEFRGHITVFRSHRFRGVRTVLCSDPSR
jgi:hypothetical protein